MPPVLGPKPPSKILSCDLGQEGERLEYFLIAVCHATYFIFVEFFNDNRRVGISQIPLGKRSERLTCFVLGNGRTTPLPAATLVALIITL